MTKTIIINGIKRILPYKNTYGMYVISLDDKDVKWINKVYTEIESIRSSKNAVIVRLEDELRELKKKYKHLGKQYHIGMG